MQNRYRELGVNQVQSEILEQLCVLRLNTIYLTARGTWDYFQPLSLALLSFIDYIVVKYLLKKIKFSSQKSSYVHINVTCIPLK